MTTPGSTRPWNTITARAAAAWVLGLALASGCATSRPVAHAAAAGSDCGIHVEALRLSAAGYILDFRYRVLDPDRAAPLLDGKQRPYLLDGKGAKLGVPDTPILGSLRQTSRNGKVNLAHSYFMLFANPGKYLQPGDRVTLVAGDVKLPGLTVEGR